MEAINLSIPDVILLQPKVFDDERGFFFESYNQQTLHKLIGLKKIFVQDNHSSSQQGVLRGLHYQLPPMAQGKLVRVTKGEVYDVAVDIRQSSPTFGQWVGEYLSEENKKQLWIPEGFAHAYIVLSDSAEFLYKTTNYYSPEHERCIMYNDEDIGIEWPKGLKILLSEKDKIGLRFSNSELFS